MKVPDANQKYKIAKPTQMKVSASNAIRTIAFQITINCVN